MDIKLPVPIIGVKTMVKRAR